MILKKNNNGNRLNLRFSNPNYPSGVEEVQAMVQTHVGSFYILSNCELINGGGNGFGNSHEFAYAYNIGSSGVLNRQSMGNRFLSASMDSEDLLMKQTSAGTLFRRIIEKNTSMSYLGPVNKDPELCKQPAGHITVVENDWLKNNGWEVYKQEPSAEDKVKNTPTTVK